MSDISSEENKKQMIEKYNETVDLDCKMTTGTITNCKQSDNEVAFGMFKARN